MTTNKLDNLTPQQITDLKVRIDGMTQFEMCREWRFSSAGSPFFCNPEVYAHWEQKFQGFTPEISKSLGW